MREENGSAGDALAAPRPRKQLANERHHSQSSTSLEPAAGEAEEEDEDTAMYQLRRTGNDDDDDDDYDDDDEEVYEAEHTMRQVGHLSQNGGARSPESSLSSRTGPGVIGEAARMGGRGKHGNVKGTEVPNAATGRGAAGNRKVRQQPQPPAGVARKSPPPPTGAGHPALATTTLGGFPMPIPDRQLSEDQGSHSSTNWGSDGDEEETETGAWPSAGRKRPNGGTRGTDSGDEPRPRKHPRSSSNDDDETEDQNVRTGRKKPTGPMECSVEGCTKKSRGSSGLCRSHGGGEKCVVEGCRGFARLDGRCCMHGGAQMCNVQGCQRRARFFGRCTMHGGYVNCKEEGCTLRAVGKGKCAKHGGKDHCKHPGCCRPRLKSRDDWCYTHYTHVERFREQLVGERLRGFPVVQCGYFEHATSEQCPETGLSRSGLCPEHLTYSLCGDAASCQKRAQVKGRCLEHAHEPQCQQFDCYRRAEGNQGLCREHDSWRFQCVRQGCPGRTFTADMLCPAHDKGLLRPDESQMPPMAGLGVSTETMRMKGNTATGVPPPPLGNPVLSRRGSGRMDMSAGAPVPTMAYEAQPSPIILAQQQQQQQQQQHSPRVNAAVLDWQAERGGYHPHHGHHLQGTMPLQRLLQAAKERDGSENSLEGMVPSHISDPSHGHGLPPASLPLPGPGQLSPSHLGPGSYRTSTTTTTITSSTGKPHPPPSMPLMEFLGGGLMVGPPPGATPPPELTHPLIYSVPSGHHHPPKPLQHHPHHVVPHHHSARQPTGALASHNANAPSPYPTPQPVNMMSSAGLALPGHMPPMSYGMSPVSAPAPLHHHSHPAAYGRYYVQQQQQLAANAGRDYMTPQHQHHLQQQQPPQQQQQSHHQQQQAVSQGLAVRTLDRVAIGSSQPQQQNYQISEYSSAN